MAGSSGGTVSFQVTAHVGRGDQVMVCGEEAILGRWDPRRAVPLHTTPADYPLWLSKDLPKPPGKSVAYRYCVFRGGRFLRWEDVARPRIIRSGGNFRPQLPRDALDRDSTDHREESDDGGGHERDQEQKRQDVGSGLNGNHHGTSTGTALDGKRDPKEQQQPIQQQQQPQAVYNEVPVKNKDHVSRFPSSNQGDEGRLEKCFTDGVSTAGGFDSSQLASAGAIQGEDSADVSPGEQCGEQGDALQPLPFAAEVASRIRRMEADRAPLSEDSGEDAGVDGGMMLLTPPSLDEEEEGDGGGLGLGLRLGTEAMSPPSTILDKSFKKTLPQPWSPRTGSVVVASFYLPVTVTKLTTGGQNASTRWVAEWDYEQLIALQSDLRVLRIGTVRSEERIKEEDKPAVTQALWELHCVPVFLSKSVADRCYYKYCKGVLWPVFHDILEVYDNQSNSLLDDKAITDGWQAYKNVNRAFRDKVVEIFNEGDMIWVHGFHLAILPAFLSRTVKVARIGLFMHTPFPPSEIFRALPQREDLLRGMLGADQVGFHRVVDSRHFMSSCRKVLGLHHVYTPEAGLVQIVHGGKAVILTNRHAGVDPQAVRTALSEQLTKQEAAKIRRLHAGRMIIGGVERVERIKGVWLKLHAFENMLLRNPDLVGRVSMHEVGISNPARGCDYQACQEQISQLVTRLNTEFGDGTVVYEEKNIKDVTLLHRAALMSECAVFVKTPVRDGFSTTPLEFRIVQQLRKKGEALASESAPAVPAVLIMSGEVSCVQALRGGFMVNPWKVQAVGEAMAAALRADDSQRIAWHEADVEWCESNTTAAWAGGVLGILATVPKENRTRYATTGLGLTSRVVGTDPTFKRLDTSAARLAYSTSNCRVFFLDFGGTLVKDSSSQHSSDGSAVKSNIRFSHAPKLVPSKAVIDGLKGLCSDPKNLVFVVSGRCKEELQDAFGHIKDLGLAAEHGSFFRWPSGKATAYSPYSPPRALKASKTRITRAAEKTGENTVESWEALHPGLVDTAWKDIVRRFMEDFQMNTHGSYIEEKGTAMLWHYGDADPEFGVLQLQDELTDVLGSSSGSNSTVDALVEAPGSGVIGGAVGIDDSGETCALSCSSRSSSAASSDNRSGGMAIFHEEGSNFDASGGGPYVEVRARGASKGNFVRMVLSRLGWSKLEACSSTSARLAIDAGVGGGGGRFCLCVGDDVSDEDMFLAVKSYEGLESPSSPGKGEGIKALPTLPVSSSTPTKLWQQQQQHQKQQQQSRQSRQAYMLTVTVGCKPSDADAWLPTVDAVVSLLRSLVRMPRRRNTTQAQLSKLFLADKPGGAVAGDHSASPVRSVRCVSAGTAETVYASMGTGCVTNMEMSVSADMGEDMERPVAQGNTGGDTCKEKEQQEEKMPAERRHSYSSGATPRISITLTQFLRSVAQPEPEPLMF